MKVQTSVFQSYRGPILIYMLGAMALWPVPVFQVLHAESCAVIAIVGFFVAGHHALRAFAHAAPFQSVLRAHLILLFIPLFLLTISLFWAANWGYAQGVLFFGMFPVISVGLGVALAYALSTFSFKRLHLIFALVGVGILISGPLYDLGGHPQFYTYNHLFGGVLGPIYDEELALRPGLFAFRGLTLLWTGFLYAIGRHRRNPKHRPFLALILLFLIGGAYTQSARLGINTPDWWIQKELGQVHETSHFKIYYDSSAVSPATIERLGWDHEFRYAQLAERLDVQITEPIHSYLYPDAATKAALTGARRTNVAPVWLATPQVHVLLAGYDHVFPHELAHVFSRPFGLPILHASWAVGLVEGFAGAMEPPDGWPPPHAQVAATLAFMGRQGPHQLAEALVATLTPWDFWGGRGAVSYTTVGSFVQYLLDVYGVERFKAVYAWGNFEAVYGKPLSDLASEWAQFIHEQTVVQATTSWATTRFGQPSLFERSSPHYVPPYRRLTRRAQAQLAKKDTAQALILFERVLNQAPTYAPALYGWSEIHLMRGTPETVVARVAPVANDSTTAPLIWQTLADAYALAGEAVPAQYTYVRAVARYAPFAQNAMTQTRLRAMLARNPPALRILYTPQSPAEKAKRLRPFTDPAATFFRAFLHAQAEQYAAASALLQTVSPTMLDADLAFQRLIWLARFQFNANDFDAAETTIAQALAQDPPLDQPYMRAYLADFLDQIRWRRNQ